jgi:hypothetical protein
MNEMTDDGLSAIWLMDTNEEPNQVLLIIPDTSCYINKQKIKGLETSSALGLVLSIL